MSGQSRRFSRRGAHAMKATLEIRDEIVRILEANVESQVRPTIGPRRCAAVGGWIHGNDEALIAAEAHSHPEEREPVQERIDRRLGSWMQQDAEQTTRSAKVALPDRVAAIVGQR